MARRTFYWDSSVFLCFLNREEEDRRLICEDVLQHASMDEFRIVTSCYTIVEVIRPKKKSLPRSSALTPEQVKKIHAMFRWPFIMTIELDDRTAHYASELARDHGLAPADAVHAASAILWKAEELHAWDRDFASISHLITIDEPRLISKQRLFEGMHPTRLGPAPEDFETK